MTLRQPRCSVSHSISPVTSNVPAPSGAGMEDEELFGGEIAAEPAVPRGDRQNGERAGEAEDEKGESEKQQEDEEIRKPRVGVRPQQPTKAEVDEHYPLHLNYRSWCEHCRAGKARLAPHIREPADRDRLGITVSCDYAFMTAEEADPAAAPWEVADQARSGGRFRLSKRRFPGSGTISGRRLRCCGMQSG